MSTQPHLNKPKILSNGVLFSMLDANELETVARFANARTCDRGTVVCTEGSDGDAMYVIANGRVKISLTANGGKEIVLGTLGQGDTFGEISLLDGKERTATAETLEPSKLLEIRREDVLGYMRKQPLVTIKLMAALAARLRRTDELMKDSLSLNLPSMLAKAVLGLAKTYGYNITEGVKIDVPLYEDELVYRLRISKEKVAAQIEIWQEQGLLEIIKDRLVITDPYKFAMLV